MTIGSLSPNETARKGRYESSLQTSYVLELVAVQNGPGVAAANDSVSGSEPEALALDEQVNVLRVSEARTEVRNYGKRDLKI